jgi:hypothetical protein
MRNPSLGRIVLKPGCALAPLYNMKGVIQWDIKISNAKAITAVANQIEAMKTTVVVGSLIVPLRAKGRTTNAMTVGVAKSVTKTEGSLAIVEANLATETTTGATKVTKMKADCQPMAIKANQTPSVKAGVAMKAGAIWTVMIRAASLAVVASGQAATANPAEDTVFGRLVLAKTTVIKSPVAAARITTTTICIGAMSR